MKKLERVAVIDAGYRQFLGFGQYLGDRFRPGVNPSHVARAFMEAECVAAQYNSRPCPEVTFNMLTNPMIKLDSGQIVWGYESWWGSAAEFVSSGNAERFGAFDLDRWADDGAPAPPPAEVQR